MKTKLHEQTCSQQVIYCYEREDLKGDVADERIKLHRFYDDENGKWMDWTVLYDNIDKAPEYMDEVYIRAVADAMTQATKDYGE